MTEPTDTPMIEENDRLKKYPCCLDDSHLDGFEGNADLTCKRHKDKYGRPVSRVVSRQWGES